MNRFNEGLLDGIVKGESAKSDGKMDAGKLEIIKNMLHIEDDETMNKIPEDALNSIYASIENSESEEVEEAKDDAITSSLNLEDGALDKADEEDKEALVAAVGEKAEEGESDDTEKKGLAESMSNDIYSIIEALEGRNFTVKETCETIAKEMGMKVSEAADVYRMILEDSSKSHKIDRIYETIKGSAIADAYECSICSDNPSLTVNNGEGEASKKDIEEPCKSLEGQTGEKV